MPVHSCQIGSVLLEIDSRRVGIITYVVSLELEPLNPISHFWKSLFSEIKIIITIVY